MSPLLANLVALAVAGFIVWWFWLSKPLTARAGGDRIEIVVDGGVYQPSHIRVSAGQALTLRFLRKDPSACAEQVLFNDLDISVELPIGEPRDLRLPALGPGEYEFTCQMGMYRGSLLVE